MSMEKYGVSDKTELQRAELKTVRTHLAEVRASSEKTASQQRLILSLEKREADLLAELGSDASA